MCLYAHTPLLCPPGGQDPPEAHKLSWLVFIDPFSLQGAGLHEEMAESKGGTERKTKTTK